MTTQKHYGRSKTSSFPHTNKSSIFHISPRWPPKGGHYSNKCQLLLRIFSIWRCRCQNGHSHICRLCCTFLYCRTDKAHTQSLYTGNTTTTGNTAKNVAKEVNNAITNPFHWPNILVMQDPNSFSEQRPSKAFVTGH